MRVNSFTRFAAMAVLVGALACAGNKAETDSDETAAAMDTTTSDTLGGQNQAGDRGMERDSAAAPQYPETSDTFLQNQGPGQPGDTAGYSGMERVDTTGGANQQGRTDTTSSWSDTTGGAGAERDTTTTGYDPSQQQPRDTTR